MWCITCYYLGNNTRNDPGSGWDVTKWKPSGICEVLLQHQEHNPKHLGDWGHQCLLLCHVISQNHGDRDEKSKMVVELLTVIDEYSQASEAWAPCLGSWGKGSKKKQYDRKVNVAGYNDKDSSDRKFKRSYRCLKALRSGETSTDHVATTLRTITSTKSRRRTPKAARPEPH
jgi:hypothetical protein